MNFKSFLQDNIVIFDGATGTLLQERGLRVGELPERLNITAPEVIEEIHREYYDAGANVATANTFGANTLKFSPAELSDIVKAAIDCAKRARDNSKSNKEKFIALDIGPTGKLLAPLGELDFEEAVSIFAETAKLGEKFGADLIIIETMNDSYETKAALLAVKENSSLPVIVSNAYGDGGKLMTGASPEAMVAMLEGMGADVIGANCSFGPSQLQPVVRKLLDRASTPIIFQPNAGLPKSSNGKTVFDVTPEEFAEEVVNAVRAGVRIIGGCCGTTPEYIRLLSEKTKGLLPSETEDKNITVVSSYTHAVEFGGAPVLIGERINPTGKKRFRQALIENDMAYILDEGIRQEEKGVHILDVNVGIPDIDEVKMLKDTVCELQAVTDLPLQLDTSDAKAMEAALRRYNGKAMINSVNGKVESMEMVFPLVKKYGGVVVALTLDENGIPASAEDRFKIAEKILIEAEKYGIAKKNIVFDTLAMTISADSFAAVLTVNSLGRIRKELGCHTSLGVSNVSFGLPNRDAINGTFFAIALENGLSAAIMNPYSADMMKTYYTYNALHGYDENCSEYIANAERFSFAQAEKTEQLGTKKQEEYKSELSHAIIKGFKKSAGELTENLLKANAPLDIVQNEIIPALNIVGEGFEKKTMYLPQLLMSAEAAKSAFEVIKKNVSSNENASQKGTVLIATVRGDIHDIGKNIVKLLLENYGYNVIDLGKDVPPEKILEAVLENNVTVVGLSALMTTTVPAMEETIALLHEKAKGCRVLVGGAVLTQEYADKIGAYGYTRDAMEMVRVVGEIMA